MRRRLVEAMILVGVGCVMAGCGQTRLIKLDASHGYVPPYRIPYSVASDRDAYLAAHRKMWLTVAQKEHYELNLKTGAHIISIGGVVFSFPGDAPQPVVDGEQHGYDLAIRQLNDLLKSALADMGLPHQHLEGTADEPTNPNADDTGGEAEEETAPPSSASGHDQ